MRSDEIPTIRSVKIDVPELGIVNGISLNDEVCQYLGVPYANIPGRFRRSTLWQGPWKGGKHDGSKFGPYCPQPPRDFYPVPSPARPWLEMPQADEFNCLNLNISVPRLPLSSDAPTLPVMVFMHGGAFTYSMNSSPIYDGRMLASASASLSKPTIIITVNYRLGVYGFLAGQDILEYNKSHGEAGVGNYGIWDQVLALRWVQKHIRPFGGDPCRVTLFGQSAGAASSHAHILRKEPLFSSVILQSGQLGLCGVLSIDEYQIVYEKMLSNLGIPLDLPPAERLQRLLETDAAKITAAMVPTFIIPVVTTPLCDDGVLIKNPMATYDDHDSFIVPDWCRRVMLGDARNECIIWNKSWDNLSPVPMSTAQHLSVPIAELTLSKMASYLGHDLAQQIARLYSISTDSSPQEVFWALERMTSHGMYSAPVYFAQKTAAKQTTNVFAYHFDVPSPYDNAWGGLAHHSNDNVLIWGILRHTLPASQQVVADKMTEAWISFANDEDPWEKFTDQQKWMVFSEDKADLKTRDEDKGRGYDIWEQLLDIGAFKKLARLSEELCLRKNEILSRQNLKTG